MAPLLSPAARAVFTPAEGKATDLTAFLRAGGTCYLMADERRAASLAPVISAFADDYIETCKRIADPLPGGRLDPPCGLFLDEVANIVPLPQLPALMSFAGGTGIFLVAVLQSMAQARNRWGRDAAEMLWGAATVKVILGGLAGEDLREISELAGEYRELLTTSQRGRTDHSVQTTLQDRKTMTPGEVRHPVRGPPRSARHPRDHPSGEGPDDPPLRRTEPGPVRRRHGGSPDHRRSHPGPRGCCLAPGRRRAQRPPATADATPYSTTRDGRIS